MDFLKSKENKILAFLVINAVLFVTLFFFDLNKKIDIGDREIIGTVEFKKNTVQRKLDDHIVWESLYNDSPITNKDTIRSESLSDAIIRLNDGTEINLDENSMFYLDITGNDPTISFNQGSIQIKKKDSHSDGDLKIQSNDKTIEVKNGELNIQKAENGNFQVQVEKGNATVSSGGKETQVGSGKQANLTGDKLHVTNIPFSLLSPSNNEIIQSSDSSKTINFNWKANEKFSNIRFEVSRNPSFTPILKTIDSPSTSFTLNLPLGSYYWRIRSDNGNSVPYRFHLYKEEDINLRFPENDSQILYVEKLPLVSFQWNRDQFTKEYILEISESADFKSLMTREVTKTNSFSLENLSVGRFFWRIKAIPYSPNLPERISKSRNFSIKKGDNFGNPKIERPNGELLLASTFPDQGIFIWSGSHELVKYEVTIAKDSNFQSVIYKKDSYRNFIQPNIKLTKGNFFWRVKGFSASNKQSDYSQFGKFSIVEKESELLVPVKNEEEENETSADLSKKILKYPVDTVVDLSGQKSLNFNWNKVNDGFIYIVSIYKDNDGKKTPIYQVKTKETNFKLNDLTILDEGKFSWDVSILSGTKQLKKESGKFIITLTKLRNLKPSDIEFISPEILYREGKK
jgi:hypothetical protein